MRWTSRSTRALAAALTADGHPVSHDTVAELLRSLGYSLQGTRETDEGAEHPDRDAQFHFINDEGRVTQVDRPQLVVTRAGYRFAIMMSVMNPAMICPTCAMSAVKSFLSAGSDSGTVTTAPGSGRGMVEGRRK